MRIFYLLKILIFILIISCFFGYNSYALNKIILIDPGHGGIDGGAVSSSNTLEKDLNLEISCKLREILESKNYKVYMTRESDISLSDAGSIKEKKREDLSKRCAMKKQVACDVFLSIHMNKFPNASVKGSQVWYPINSVKSKKLAESMHKQFKVSLNQECNREPKGVKNEYVILRDGYSEASIIVECGFLSNQEEEDKLKDSKYQYELCNAMVLAIEEYFNGGNLN